MRVHIIRVLGHKLAAKGLGEDRLGKFLRVRLCFLVVPGFDPVGEGEEFLNPADDFLLSGMGGREISILASSF